MQTLLTPPATARLRLPRPAALLLAFVITQAGACGDRVVRPVVIDGIEFGPWGEAAVPAADLRRLGSVAEIDSEVVLDPTVYAVSDIDPATLVAFSIDQEAWKRRALQWEHGPESATPPTVELWVRLGAELPEAACRYFDPRSEASPPDCQDPVLLTWEGHDWIPVERIRYPEGPKFGAPTFVFAAADLIVLGPLSDPDPRLGADVRGTIYGLRGPAAGTVVILVGGTQLEPSFIVLVPEGTSEIPTELCPYVRPGDEEFGPRGCAARPAHQNQILEDLHRRERAWEERAPAAYTFTIESTCFCPPEWRGPFTVTVADHDRVVEVHRGGALVALGDPTLDGIPTRVLDLFDVIQLWASADAINVEYDATYGFPTLIEIDPRKDAIDEEFGFIVSAFEVQP